LTNLFDATEAVRFAGPLRSFCDVVSRRLKGGVDSFCHSPVSFIGMATLNISLPDEMRAFVDGEVASGDYGTASAYVQQLIRRDKRRAEVRQLILDGISSESAGEFDDAFRQELRERASGYGR
jgi:antitoxin ParD1/3/4